MIHESLWDVYALTPSSAVTKPVVGVFDLAANVSEGKHYVMADSLAAVIDQLAQAFAILPPSSTTPPEIVSDLYVWCLLGRGVLTDTLS